jgi:hypothetical protein
MHGFGRRYSTRGFDVAVVSGNAMTCPDQRHELIHKRRNCLDFAPHRQIRAKYRARMAGLANFLLKSVPENRFSRHAETDVRSHASSSAFIHYDRRFPQIIPLLTTSPTRAEIS